MMGGPSTTMRDRLRTMLNTTHKDGMTIKQGATLLSTSTRSIENSFDNMPDVYVDRWDYPRDEFGGKLAGPPFKIYCAVEVPADCPRPDTRIEQVRKARGLPESLTAHLRASPFHVIGVDPGSPEGDYSTPGPGYVNQDR